MHAKILYGDFVRLTVLLNQLTENLASRPMHLGAYDVNYCPMIKTRWLCEISLIYLTGLPYHKVVNCMHVLGCICRVA